jgi:hypothetical protein
MKSKIDWIKFNKEDNKFSWELDFSELQVMSKDDCIDHTIECITNDYDNLHLSLSGGMDSEFVADCLVSRGVKFKPVIVDFGTNSPESWYAYLWCKKNNIEPLVVNLTREMVLKTFSHYALKHSTSFMCGFEFVLDYLIDGHLILGCGDPFKHQDCSTDKLNESVSPMLEISSFDFGLELSYPKKHPASFFLYTPNLLHHMVKNIDYSKPLQMAKAEYYGVMPRPKISAAMSGMDFQPVASMVNSKVPLHMIKLGEKETFLNVCENRQKINFEYVR